MVAARLRNGFILTESSACVDPANYDAELGKRLCLQHIENRLWELEGYALQKRTDEERTMECAAADTETQDFGWTLNKLRCDWSVRRRGWNGKGVFIKLQEIAAIEGVDIVLSNNDKGMLYKRVVELSGKGRAQIYSCDTESLTSFFAAFSSGDRTRAFLKVQDGCDYKCAYCTIHYARGGSRNMPIADLVAEARQIAAAGQKEIVITGINTGDFGRTTGERFIDLLRALNEVEGIERYRISSIEPNLLTDEIIAFCAASPKFQHHFHIPLQSGSDKILGLMRRRYTTARFADRIAAVRALMPDAFIGIDVIVGFPGETEEDFRTTYDFLARLEPAFLHIFPFSERPGTPAVDLPGKVRPSVATQRVAELEGLCERLHGAFCARAEGTEDTVLFESTRRDGMMFGFTGSYRRVKVPYHRSKVNAVCRVKLGAMDETHDLLGEILD